jgi:Ca2+-binding EF-hand superfamily protein
MKELLQVVRQKMESMAKGGGGQARKMFKQFDRDGSGSISKEEFKQFLKLMGIELGDEEFEKFFDSLDEDASGTLMYNEFVKNVFDSGSTTIDVGSTKGEAEKAEETLKNKLTTNFANFRQAFMVMDQNRDNKLSLSELRAAINHAGIRLSGKELKRLMELMSGSSDSEFATFEQFANRMGVNKDALSGQQAIPGQELGGGALTKFAMGAHRDKTDTASMRKTHGVSLAAEMSDLTSKFLGQPANFQYTYRALLQQLRLEFGTDTNTKAELFQAMDKDGSGYLDKVEFGDLMRTMGYNLSDENVRDFFGRLDTDKSGSIDYKEFLYHVTDKGGTANDTDLGKGTAEEADKAFRDKIYQKHKNLTQAFRHLDEDKDNFLDISELRKAVDTSGVSLSQKELKKLMKRYDLHGNGKLSFEDFEKVMKTDFYSDDQDGLSTLLETHGHHGMGVHNKTDKEKFVYSYPRLVTVIRNQFDHINKEEKDKVFDELDADSSGTIDPSEFRALLSKWGYKLKLSEVEDFFSHIDTDGSGELDYDEFLAHMWNDGATSSLNNVNKGTAAQAMKAFQSSFYTRYKSLHDAFLHFDADRTQYIGLQELRSMADKCGVSLGNAELKKLMGMMDVDCDGKIGFNDFEKGLAGVFYGADHGLSESMITHNGPGQSAEALAAQMNSQKKKFVYSYANLLLALRKELTGDGPSVAAKQKKFADLDKNKDGNVSKGELGDMIRYFGFNLTSAQVDDFFSYMDTDESGTIEFEEFLAQVEGKGASKLIGKAGKQAAADITRMIAAKFGARGANLTKVFAQSGLDGDVSFVQLHQALAGMNIAVTSAQLRPLFAIYSAPDHDGQHVFHLADFITTMEMSMPQQTRTSDAGSSHGNGSFSLESPERPGGRQSAWGGQARRPDSRQRRRPGGGGFGGRSLRAADTPDYQELARNMGAEERAQRENRSWKDTVQRLEYELLRKMGRNNWQRMLTIFRKCDTDKSGFLGAIEFRQALQDFDMPLPRKDFEVLWRAHMIEGVNQINYRDFLRHFIVTLKLNDTAATNTRPEAYRQEYDATGPGVWAVQYGEGDQLQQQEQSRMRTLPSTGRREQGRPRALLADNQKRRQQGGSQRRQQEGGFSGRSQQGPGIRQNRGGVQLGSRSQSNSRSSSRPDYRGGGQIVVRQPIQLPENIKQQIAGKWKSIRKTCQDIDKDRVKTIEARDMLAVLTAFNIDVTVQDIMKLPGKGKPGPARGIRYNELVKACLQR